MQSMTRKTISLNKMGDAIFAISARTKVAECGKLENGKLINSRHSKIFNNFLFYDLDEFIHMNVMASTRNWCGMHQLIAMHTSTPFASRIQHALSAVLTIAIGIRSGLRCLGQALTLRAASHQIRIRVQALGHFVTDDVY